MQIFSPVVHISLALQSKVRASSIVHLQAFDPLHCLKQFLSLLSSFFEWSLVSPLHVVILCSIVCMGHAGALCFEAGGEK